MIKPDGIHHIAVMTADVKAQLEFFTDVLGCKLSAIFDMHGVPGGIHAFVHLDDDCYFSFVQLPGTGDIPIELGKTHSGTGAGPSAPGTMQHLAFRVASDEDLLSMRDRIRTKGVNVIGPLDHGMCRSIYFAGPEQLTLEVATSNEEVEPARWIDPSVLDKVGISQEEAQRFANPDAYAGDGGKVAQPPYDAAKPHQAYPMDMYRKMLAAPDEAVWESSKANAKPPVS